MGELKPCPFCGGSALLRGFAVDEAMHWWVACENCGATSGELLAESTPDRDFAVESWNHRTHPQPVTPAGGEVTTVIAEMEAACPGNIGPDADYSVDASTVWAWAQALKATHPPVADAALVRDAERWRMLKQLDGTVAWRTKHDAHSTGISQDYGNLDAAMDAAIQDAALNQRGGGDHG